MRGATLFVTLKLATLIPVAFAPMGPATASEPVPSGTSDEALRIAQASQPGWRLGRLVAREHDGRRHVEAELLSGGTPVAWLRVDPGTGRFLSRGERPVRGQPLPDPAQLRLRVEKALSRIEVGTWAWPADHGRAWAVPLRWEGRVVSAVKIDVRGARVLAAEYHDEDND